MKHLIKKEIGIKHGTIGWSHNGNDSQYCEAGEVVKIKWQPDVGWGLHKALYQVEGEDPVIIEDGEFVMPNADIVIMATFKRFLLEDWAGSGLNVEGDLNVEGSINAKGGVILTDTETGTEYVIKVTNGVLGIEEL